jgi:hypothetical protein
MKKILTAVALSIAVPAVAHEQAAPAPTEDCCEKMKAEGKECCCKDMAGKGHAKHDMKHSDAQVPQGEAHEGHQQ